ncbi:Hint domain-containing protein [Thioclava sp. 'Guangxiensis']|uniref:Hint domain-containing protein n=1 Tax=Thioclava sp. 'Guangxiensis' TaxID=3149044 RepID=UPI003877E672
MPTRTRDLTNMQTYEGSLLGLSDTLLVSNLQDSSDGTLTFDDNDGDGNIDWDAGESATWDDDGTADEATYIGSGTVTSAVSLNVLGLSLDIELGSSVNVTAWEADGNTYLYYPDGDQAELLDGLVTQLTDAISPLLLSSVLDALGVSSLLEYVEQNAVLTFDLSAGTSVQFPVCFAAGTQIETEDGPVDVETLTPGCRIRTMDHGYQPLKWIGTRHLSRRSLERNPKLRPIRIEKNALGRGLPEQDLVVSPQHRILVRSKISQRMFGQLEVLVPANKLTSLEGVSPLEDVESVDYYHLLFDQHEIVFSNGAASESLYTGPQALKSLSPEAFEEVQTLFPELCAEDHRPMPARFLPEKGKVMKKLVARHQSNHKPLYA